MVINADGNVLMRGPYSLYDYPMNYVSFQRRSTDGSEEVDNPYHQNIQSLGVLLLELVLDVEKVPTHQSGDATNNAVQDIAAVHSPTSNMTSNNLCQIFLADCPPQLEALILWCIDSDPFLLPTMLHCREEMRSIYSLYCTSHHIPIDFPTLTTDPLETDEIEMNKLDEL